MALDVELRNALGGLTAQVAELTKQSKTLDTTLAGALEKGGKAAGGMSDRTRQARQELSLVDDVAQKMGATFGRQMLSLATGAMGVTAIWQNVSGIMQQATQRAEAHAKAANSFAAGTRRAGADNPALRRTMQAGGNLLTPEEQSSALQAYEKAGGKADVASVSGLASFLDQAVELGLDPNTSAGTYGRLTAAGVSNPGDVIARAKSEGRDLSGMKTPALRAYARQGATAGALSRLKGATTTDATDAAELDSRKLNVQRLELQIDDPASALRAKVLDRVRSVAAEMGHAKRNTPADITNSVQRVIIDGDARPMPINAGE
jgi:hypothetical protein